MVGDKTWDARGKLNKNLNAETKRKNKKKRFLREKVKANDREIEVDRESLSDEEKHNAGNRIKQSIEDDVKCKVSQEEEKEEEEVNRMVSLEEENPESSENAESRKNRRKKHLLEEAAMAENRGICYLSRIPPHMDPLKLRQILSQYGEIHRIYLATKDSATRVQHKRAVGGNRGQNSEKYTEGWVEFAKKTVAKRVANMLNGEQIGGRKRSTFYYDLWNIKYLSKFKWDTLLEEIAYKSAMRKQKIELELSAANKEQEFYLSKVDKSRALSSIEERMKKKRKVQQETGADDEVPIIQEPFKVIRQFPQTRAIKDTAEKSKPGISKDILAGVFGP